MKKLFIILAIVCCPLAANAQSAETSSLSNTHPGKQLHKGYKGYADVLGYLGFYNDGFYGGFSLMTSHGYQFNPYFFLGAGVGLDSREYGWFDDNHKETDRTWTVPVYVHNVTSFLEKGVTPFVDVKLGYSMGEYSGFYRSAGIGCRFGISNSCGLSLSTGFTRQNYTYESRDYAQSDPSAKKKTDEALREWYIKLSLDF